MSDRVRRAHAAGALRPGMRLALDPEEAHHVGRVLRLRPGDALSVFDGRGGEWAATIETVGRDGVGVRLGDPLPGEPEPPIAVALFQAIVRPERVEWVLQKGTEIGVASFRLVAAERSEAPPPSPARLERYRRVVLEACKQSGRRLVPALETGSIDPPPEGGAAFVLDAGAGAPPIGCALAGAPVRDVRLAVGPEGGFTGAEIEAMEAQGWLRASLGPRVLRTETAGPVAAAIVLHAWGDLGASPKTP